MASVSERHNAGGDGRPITEWTSFKESDGRVKLYISEVSSKAAGRDYKSAGDVFVDYEPCVKLLIKLMEESSGFAVASYEKRMLCSFSTMFLAIFNRLDQQSVDWLKEDKSAPEVLLSESEDSIAPEVLLSESENSIKRLDRNVKMMDDDLQSDINKLKEGHLQYLQSFLDEYQQTQNEIQAYLDANKEDENAHREMCMQTEDHFLRLNTLYEDVKCTISRAVVDMRSLTKLSRSYYQTLGHVEETIVMLEVNFFKLVRRSDKDVSQKWLEATHYMDEHPLVRREKELNEKARAGRDMQWERTKLSSGLLH
ncbi:hypothetical protein MKW92_034663 [Papaver armeniacum]|nr:hypothetical protein MKW92_034663 [Papaver armeniacum]